MSTKGIDGIVESLVVESDFKNFVGDKVDDIEKYIIDKFDITEDDIYSDICGAYIDALNLYANNTELCGDSVGEALYEYFDYYKKENVEDEYIFDSEEEYLNIIDSAKRDFINLIISEKL